MINKWAWTKRCLLIIETVQRLHMDTLMAYGE